MSHGDARSAAALAPLIREQIAAAGVLLRDVGLIAVTSGPGSFTGLRIGVTTAKTLAYALGCNVLGVDTLEVIAHQVPANVPSVWAVLDAHRQELFAAHFGRRDNGTWAADPSTHILDVQQLLNNVSPDVHFTGPGLQRIRDVLPRDVPVVAEENWHPQAETVGRLAHSKFNAGHRDDLWTLAPLYLRPSAAEEKLAKEDSTG